MTPGRYLSTRACNLKWRCCREEKEQTYLVIRLQCLDVGHLGALRVEIKFAEWSIVTKQKYFYKEYMGTLT